MNVVNTLSAVTVTVGDQSVARLPNACLTRELGRHGNHAADQRLVVPFKLEKSLDVLVGNHQQVGRCCWVDILEREYLTVVVDDFGWNLALGHLTE